MHVKVLLCFGFVIWLYTKQTEDGGPGQRKPLAASAIQQHQKPSEDVKFLPELRTMKSQIALLKYFTQGHTHCTYSVELTKSNVKVHITWKLAKGWERALAKEMKHFISIGKKLAATFVTVAKAIVFRLELSLIP